MQLVMLVLASNFKIVGTEKVFKKVVNELEFLCTEGIVIDGTRFKIIVFCICGDNLGSNFIGGFVKCFNRNVQNPCRVCMFSGKTAAKDYWKIQFPLRTKASYEESLNKLQDPNVRKQSVNGVKFNSDFNALPNFHVTDYHHA